MEKRDGTSGGGPLEGLTILDAASLLAGPMAATFLTDLGARVIKVEDPQTQGDALRRWGAAKNGVGIMWKSVGRNKECLTIDFRKQSGRNLLRRIISELDIDVIILNNRTETLEEWGLDYAALQSCKRGLVMLHITAFGSDGPYANRPGFGTVTEAMSGFAHTNGVADGPPILPSFALADMVSGLTGAMAILAAMYDRDVHGAGGQRVDVNLLEPLARMLEYNVLAYDQLGTIARRAGNQWGWTAPRDTYRCRDGNWVAISGSIAMAVRNILRAVDRPDLADEFAEHPQRRIDEADVISAAIREWVVARDYPEVCEVFERFRVPYGPVYDASQLVGDPHVVESGVFQRHHDEELGEVLLQRPVVQMSGTRDAIRFPGRPVGDANWAVLVEEMGISEDEFQALISAGVIGDSA